MYVTQNISPKDIYYIYTHKFKEINNQLKKCLRYWKVHRKDKFNSQKTNKRIINLNDNQESLN